MRNQRLFWITVLLAASVLVGRETLGQSEGNGSLCRVLETIRPGERLTLTASGIYAVGPEQQVFFDPKQPNCDDSVQPATWVEFQPSVVRRDQLERRLMTAGRALVTFKGELYGPGIPGPDDPSLPTVGAYANRTRGIRYGHLNGFRTKFLVSEILSVEEAPKSDQSPVVRTQPTPDLVLAAAELPVYPAGPLAAGIAGTVSITVTVKDGSVVGVEPKAGDRALLDAAVQNVKSWHFRPGVDATFTTRFVYEFGRRKAGDGALRVDVNLPSEVRVTAWRAEW